MQQFTKMSLDRRHQAFKAALADTLVKQMKKNPERYHKVVHQTPDYPKTFANHLMEKLENAQVIVLNETVADAMATLGIKGIDNLYKSLKLSPPEADEEVPEVEVKKENAKPKPAPHRTEEQHFFRGC